MYANHCFCSFGRLNHGEDRLLRPNRRWAKTWRTLRGNEERKGIYRKLCWSLMYFLLALRVAFPSLQWSRRRLCYVVDYTEIRNEMIRKSQRNSLFSGKSCYNGSAWWAGIPVGSSDINLDLLNISISRSLCRGAGWPTLGFFRQQVAHTFSHRLSTYDSHFGEALKGLYLKGLLSKHRSIACPLPLALASDLPCGVCTCKWGEWPPHWAIYFPVEPHWAIHFPVEKSALRRKPL